MNNCRGILATILATWATLAPGWSADEGTRQPPGLERSLVVSGQGYFPVALRLQDGRIAVVLRGGAGHLGLRGRLLRLLPQFHAQQLEQGFVAEAALGDRRRLVGVSWHL